jgi:hypothetical protein
VDHQAFDAMAFNIHQQLLAAGVNLYA